MSNKVSPTAYNAQVGRGTQNYMYSRHNDTGYVGDREKLFSSDVIILSRAINLVFSLSFYDARLASKSYFPVLIQTHLVHAHLKHEEEVHVTNENANQLHYAAS